MKETHQLLPLDAFRPQYDLIVVPVDRRGAFVPKQWSETIANYYPVQSPISKFDLGDIEVRYIADTTKPVAIIYACVEDRFGALTFAAIRDIAVNISDFINSEGFKGVSVAAPLLTDFGRTRLASPKVYSIFVDYLTTETACPIRIDIYPTNYRKFRWPSLSFSSDKHYKVCFQRRGRGFGTDDVFNAINDALDAPEIKRIAKEKEFCLERGRTALNEFLRIDLPAGIYDSLYRRIRYDANFSLKNELPSIFYDTEPATSEIYLLQKCAELIAYCDPHAFAKNILNKYPTQRTVLETSFIRQRDWLINLLKIKIESNNLEAVGSTSIRSALLFLSDPRRHSPMVSRRQRGMVMRNLFDPYSIPLDPDDFQTELLHFFDFLNIPCRNPDNRNLLYASILHAISYLWDEDKLNEVPTFERPFLAEARQLIKENLHTRNKRLDLGNCNIRDLSDLPELFRCTHLEMLILSNEWAVYRHEKWNRRKSGNRGNPNVLHSIPAQIGKLTNLRILICGGDWECDENDMRRWKIEDVEWISALPRLKYLNISNNRIRSLDGVEKAARLQVLHANNNQIADLKPLRELKELRDLFLSNNRIKQTASLGRLLSSIETLDLHSNLIEDLRPLRRVIEKIGIHNDKWKMQTLCVAKNPLSRPPVEIIETGREAVLDYFRQIQVGETAVNNDIKVILVGNSEAGKTTLAHYLEKPESRPATYATEWLEEREFVYRYRVGNQTRECTIKLFDFGGHDFYHDTHHLFFGTNTVYLLLWDKDNDRLQTRNLCQKVRDDKTIECRTQDYPLKYWLDSIAYFTRGVEASNFSDEMKALQRERSGYEKNLLLIQNKADTAEQVQHLDNATLIRKYPFIYDLLHVSMLSGRNREQFDTTFAELLSGSRIIGSQLPAYYMTIRDRVKQYRGRPIMEMKEFLDFCNKALAGDMTITLEQCVNLVKYLNQIGVILWYDDDPQTVFINKKWVIRSIHRILEEKVIGTHKAEFTENDVRESLRTDGDDPAETGDLKDLIRVMTKFKIVFRHPCERDLYIAPLYLPEMPVDTVKLFLHEKDIPYRRFEYEGFIHKHVILSIFQEYGQRISGDAASGRYYYWKDGLILKSPSDDCIVMIRFHQGDNEGNAHIDVYNIGEDKSCEFIDRICQYLKEISDRYPYDVSVTLDGETFVSLSMLDEQARQGNHLFANERRPTTSTKPKLIRTKDYEHFLSTPFRKKKVVISYSKKDLAHVHTLLRYLKPLIDANLIEEPWYCTMLNPGEQWEQQIRRHFEAADIVFFMVSPHFYNTPYIVQKEIPTAIDRYETNHDVYIIPIILEFYDWIRQGRYDLSRFSALPYQAKPISDFRNPNLAWHTVSLSVKAMIEHSLDPGQPETVARELQEIYERQVKGKLSDDGR